jgi:hypothetical protein
MSYKNQFSFTRAINSLLPNTLSFYAPVVPRVRRDVSAGAGGAGVVAKEDIGPFSDLLEYSATVRQGHNSLPTFKAIYRPGLVRHYPHRAG